LFLNPWLTTSNNRRENEGSLFICSTQILWHAEFAERTAEKSSFTAD